MSTDESTPSDVPGHIRRQLAVDYVRHITVLASGSVVAVAAFIRDATSPWPVAAALICFVVAVLSGMIIQLVVVAKLDSDRWVAFLVSGKYAKWRWTFIVHLLSFFFGVLSIAIYGLMNL